MSTIQRYQRNPVVSCGIEEDGAVLFNPDTDATMVINTSGERLWQFLRTPQTVDDAAAYLVESYRDVDLEQAAADAMLFVERLTPDFLIKVGDAD